MIRVVSNHAKLVLLAATCLLWSAGAAGCTSDGETEADSQHAVESERPIAADANDETLLEADAIYVVKSQDTARFSTTQLLSNDVAEIDANSFQLLNAQGTPAATITTEKGGEVTAWTGSGDWNWVYTLPDDPAFEGTDRFKYKACLEAAYGGDCEEADVTVSVIEPEIVRTHSFSTTIENVDTSTDISVFVDNVHVDDGHAQQDADWTWNYSATLLPREVHRVDFVLAQGGVITQGVVFVPEITPDHHDVGYIIQGSSISFQKDDVLAGLQEVDEDTLVLDPNGALPSEVGTLSGNVQDGFEFTAHDNYQGAVELAYRVCPLGWDIDVLGLSDGCKTAKIQFSVQAGVRIDSHDDDASTGQKPTFSGTAEPGTVITLRVDHVESGQTTAEDGLWSITPTNPIAVTQNDDTREITVSADNGASATIHIRVHEAQFEPSRDDLFTIVGQAFTFESSELVDNDGADANPVSFEINKSVSNGTLEQNEDGTWTYTPSGNATEDRFTYKVCAYVIVQDDLCEDSVQVVISAIAANKVVTIPSATMEIELPSQNATFKFNGKDVTATVVHEDDAWVWTIDQQLTPNRVYMISISIDGQAQPPMYAIYEKEEEPEEPEEPTEPETPEEDPFENVAGDAKITRPVDGSSTGNTEPLIVGEGKPGSKVKLYVMEEMVATVDVNENGEWEHVLKLPIGEYRIAVEGDDGSRHIIFFSIEDASKYKGDVSITSPVENEGFPTLSPSISGTSTAGTSVLIFMDDVRAGQVFADQDGNWFWNARNLADGYHELRVVGSNGSVAQVRFFVYEEISVDESGGCSAMAGNTRIQPSIAWIAVATLLGMLWIRRRRSMAV